MVAANPKPISQSISISDETGNYRAQVTPDQALVVTPIGSGPGGIQQVEILDSLGVPLTYNSNGQATMANSLPVVIASDQSWVGAAGLGKAEDSVHGSGDVGVMALGVVTDGSTSLAGAGDYGVIGTDAAGNVRTVGNVASGSADAGNPVKIGGVYSTSRPSPPASSRVDAQTDDRGYLAAVVRGVNLTPADGLSNTSVPSIAYLQAGSAASTVGYTFSLPFLFNGTAWDRQRMNPVASGGAALVEAGPYVFGRVTADGQIKSSAGFIHTVTISPSGSVVAGVLTIYNSTSESGTVVASFALPVTSFTPFSVTLDVACSTGIYVGFDATLANVSCTVSYR